ncbi:N-anthranilate isomerase [Peniophora sp. CONT]|nr:N-anthranilate isomerase [Peniophora sp. CONT]
MPSAATSSTESIPALPAQLTGHIDILMIDNFDSFTWNLYQSLCLLGADVTVIRNDAITAAQLPLLDIRALIVSPGPGHPITDSGVSREAIKYFAGKKPVLGVCMGLECLVDVFGGEISYSYAGEIKHGKLSRVRHDNRGCMRGAPQGFLSTRYHSLAANVRTLPDTLAVSAVTEESGVIMGVRHRTLTIEAVQYHPESILSECGDDLIRNFLALNGGTWKENPHAAVDDVELPPFDGQGLIREDAGKTQSVLEKIYAQRIKDVEAAKASPGASPADLDALLAMHLAPPAIDIVARIRAAPHAPEPALMAEIKRASPSRGAIAPGARAPALARTYAAAGAAVVSVLTEPTWFAGSLTDLRLARQALNDLPSRPAVLRKDFILDEYQIAEARLNGADSVLLIVAMLPQDRLEALYAYSVKLGMEPLVEVNTPREMDVALELGAKLVGVNNRDLHSFEVDMGTTKRLAEMVKEKGEGGAEREVVLCALSGITERRDVVACKEQGVKAVLVGEALMRASSPAALVRSLFGLPSHLSGQRKEKAPPLVKICGIRNAEEALEAANAGADMLGLMFADKSKRRISLAAAQRIASAIRTSRFNTSIPPPPSAHEIQESEFGLPWFARHAARLARQPNSRPLLVGVFQDQPLSLVLHVTAAAQLDMVQLHGREPVEWAAQIPVPVVRAFHVDANGGGLEGLTRPGFYKHVLLDAAATTGGLSGGSGKSIDWTIARQIVERGEGSGVQGESMPVILAGGLTPENVGEAVEVVCPWAVDVSGGVETGDRRGKDGDKVRAFVKAAKGAWERLEEVQDMLL